MLYRGTSLRRESVPDAFVLRLFTDWLPNQRLGNAEKHHDADRKRVYSMIKAVGGGSKYAAAVVQQNVFGGGGGGQPFYSTTTALTAAPLTAPSVGSLTLPLTPAGAAASGVTSTGSATKRQKTKSAGGNQRKRTGGGGQAQRVPSAQATQERAAYNAKVRAFHTL